MNHIATGGSSTVSIDEPAHLLLANRRCVICSADETHLKAYDLLPAADDAPFPVKHGRGEGFELRRTAAPPLNIRGYHFVGDINAEGTLGAYAVTRVSTQRQRTSHLYIFDVNTMTHIGTAKRLEYEEVKEQDVQSNNGSEHQLREPVEWAVETRAIGENLASRVPQPGRAACGGHYEGRYSRPPYACEQTSFDIQKA